MEKTFTLDDLRLYFQEIRRIEHEVPEMKKSAVGPSKMTMKILLNYSKALEVLKSKSAGTFYQLAN